MKTNLILSIVGAAALLVSPAMAQQKRPHNAASLAVPSDARASVAPYSGNEGGPYTPSIPTSRYGTTRTAPDFQNGSRG